MYLKTIISLLFSLCIYNLWAQEHKSKQILLIDFHTSASLTEVDRPLHDDLKSIGLSVGGGLEYNIGRWGFDFDADLYIYDYNRENLTELDNFQHKVAVQSLVLSASPRYYFISDEKPGVGVFIAPKIGFETAIANSKLYTFNPANPKKEECFKQKESVNSLINWGVKLGLQTQVKKVYLELFLAWTNVHLNDAFSKIDTEKYGLKPISTKGKSSQIELGIGVKVPLFRK